ncbi:SPOR domain-containing protein [Stenotrophomonas koreensis]|uniref:SPOR domain-containing protein n=1 Tax=Stenotrophomonas koreensis TaxID=266128 RepID=UPI00339574BF
MAARRNKRQAKRTTHSGTPAWVWLIAIAAIAAVVFMALPNLFNKQGDGFLRAGPRPNPDAVPAQVDEAEIDAPASLPRPAGNRDGTPAATTERPSQPSYDFYTLLPGSEVQMSDAELAATARAEAERQARAQRQTTPAESPSAPATQPAPLNENPAPVSEAQRALAALEGRTVPRPASQPASVNERPAGTERAASAPATASAPPPAAATRPVAPPVSTAEPASNVRYLLQAGAFSAQNEAEGTKARLALAGVAARVEPAQINGTTVYRVRMGPYNTASELAAAKAKLEAAGLQAMAIKAQ